MSERSGDPALAGTDGGCRSVAEIPLWRERMADGGCRSVAEIPLWRERITDRRSQISDRRSPIAYRESQIANKIDPPYEICVEKIKESAVKIHIV